MNRKKRTPFFKEWGDKTKKIDLNKDKLVFLVLIAGGIIIIILSGFYFKALIRQELLIVRKEIEESLSKEGSGSGLTSTKKSERTSPETILKLREAGIERYFLSEVQLIDGRFTPTVHTCLFKDDELIYPPYIYETNAMVIYPEIKPEIILVRYLLLPEDNTDFQPDGSCYIKEIETDQDWQELEEKYGFSRRQF